jgi:hypothetical protein
VFALHQLWTELGFGRALQQALRSSRRSFDAEALVPQVPQFAAKNGPFLVSASI